MAAEEAEIERLVIRLMGDATAYQHMLMQAGTMSQGFATKTASTLRPVEQSLDAVGRKAEETAGGIVEMLESAGTSISTLGTKLSALLTLPLTGLGFAGFAGFSEEEEALIGLTAVAEVNKREITTLIPAYQEFAAEIQKTTRTADDAALSLLKEAESFRLTGNAAKKSVKDAIALAAINKTSAESMMRVTTAMAKGDTKRAMLSARLIPQLRGVRSEQEFLLRYQGLVNAGWKTEARLADTAAGSVAKLKNQFGDLLEEIGKILADGMRPLVEHLKAGVAGFQAFSPEMKRLAVYAGVLAAGLGPVLLILGKTIGLLGTAIGVTIRLGGLFSFVFTPWGAALSLAAGAAALLIRHLGGVPATIEKLQSAGRAAMDVLGPAFKQLGNVGAAAFGAVKDVGITAYNAVAAAARAFQEVVVAGWNYLKNVTGVTWGGIKQAIIESLIAAEFAFKNLGTIAELAWVNQEYQAVRFANQVVYFFTEVIPTSVKWFAGNFHDVLYTSIDAVLTLFVNLGKNVRELWTATLNFFKTGTWEFDWTPLQEGFRSSLKSLPEFAEREVGALEKQLGDRMGVLAKGLVVDFAKLRKQRLDELGKEDAKVDSPIDEKSFKSATDAVDDLTDSLRDLKRERVEAVAFGSAEAASMLQFHRAMLAGAGGVGGAVEEVTKQKEIKKRGPFVPWDASKNQLPDLSDLSLTRPSSMSGAAVSDASRAAAQSARDAVEAARVGRLAAVDRAKQALEEAMRQREARTQSLRETLAGSVRPAGPVAPPGVGAAKSDKTFETIEAGIKRLVELAEEDANKASLEIEPVGI